jgi:hypothetical protein
MMIEELLDGLHHIPGLGSIIRVTRYLYKKLKDWMFLKTLKEAHWEWQRQHGLGTRWKLLGEGIEFSEAFARRPEGPETSRIALRSVGDAYDEITLVIELKCGDDTYDVTRRVSNVNENSRIIILPDIPAYEQFLLITEEDYKRAGLVDDRKNVLCGYSTYDSYQVRVTSLTKEGITRRVNLKGKGYFYTPIDQTSANWKDWITWKGMEWNGELVNLSVIRAQQRALKSRLWGKIGYWPFTVAWKAGRLKRQPIGSGYTSYYIRYILSSVMLSEPFIKMIYWIPLILRWRKFDPSGYGEDDKEDENSPRPDLPVLGRWIAESAEKWSIFKCFKKGPHNARQGRT